MTTYLNEYVISAEMVYVDPENNFNIDTVYLAEHFTSDSSSWIKDVNQSARIKNLDDAKNILRSLAKDNSAKDIFFEMNNNGTANITYNLKCIILDKPSYESITVKL